MLGILTSIIVPHYNGLERIRGLLGTTLPQMTEWRELIIVDDGSTDQSPAGIENAIRSCVQARLVRRVNGGRSVARNTGARQACGAFLVFLDNDIILPPDFFDRIETIHAKLPHAWITGSVVQDVIDSPHADFLTFRKRLDYVSSHLRSDSEGLAVSGTFSSQQLGVSREAFLAIGGFDERLRDCEDFELSVRVADSGQKIIHDLRNVVRHADYVDFNVFIRRQIEYKCGRERLRKLHPELVARFPNVLRPGVGMSATKKLIRRLFVFDQFWKNVYHSGLLMITPRRFRYLIYDLVISSTVLLSPEGD